MDTLREDFMAALDETIDQFADDPDKGISDEELVVTLRAKADAIAKRIRVLEGETS